MKFKKDYIDQVRFGEPPVDAPSDFNIEEVSEWEQDHKYQNQTIVFRHEGAFYLYNHSRTGSYYTDWYYAFEDEDDEIECPEVEKKEKIAYEWVVKK